MLEILDKKSIIAETNNAGDNCLHLSASGGHIDCFVQLLKLAKTDPKLHFPNHFGFYPLAYLVQHESKNSFNLFNPWIQIFKTYRKATLGTIDIANQVSGDSLLHVAVKAKNILAVKALIKEQLYANPPNLKGITPLHICAQYGFYNIVEFIKRANRSS